MKSGGQGCVPFYIWTTVEFLSSEDIYAAQTEREKGCERELMKREA